MPVTSARVAIVGAVRTPLGKFRGTLSRVPAVTLGRIAAQEAMKRARVGPSQIEEVIFGCCIQAGLGQNPARQVLLGSGIPETRGGVTVNKVCGSGMKAIMMAASSIRAGDQDLVLAGGMESMDLAPYLVPNLRDGVRYGDVKLVDAMLQDSLLDAYDHEHMGMTGEDVARRYGITRAEADQFALRSHERAVRAVRGGLFKPEIVPVPGTITGKGDLDHDEGPRPDTNLEKLAALKPSFRPDGVLTAGNSSSLSDGAAAVVLASEAKVRELNLGPLAWIHSYHTGGVAPSRVMEAPIPTVREHLARARLTIEEIDVVEHNEAFSTASIAVARELKIPDERFNVNGGAVALGHPIGCSGARIVVTLVHEMSRRKVHRGLATLCMGGGNGTSMLVESPA